MTLETFLAEWQKDNKTLTVHTSGSTGNPKPLQVEKARMLNSARITCDYLQLKSGDTALLCMPLDYIAGKMMVVRSIERNLRLLSVEPSGHPLSDASLSVLETPEISIDFVAMVPLQVYNSLQVPEECERLKRIRHLIIGGGAIDNGLAAALKDFPNAVWSTYGMTETLSHIALRRLNGADASEWYEPFETVEISLNEEGCLMVNAPLVSAEVLTTNDIAEIRKEDTKTRFRIIGRKDNVINTGGIKIQIEELEMLLRPHLFEPYAVTKRSHEKFGEEVVLLTESTELEAIETICRRILPKYWMPHSFQTVAAIPTTETGKIARAEAMKLVDRVEE